MFGSPMMVNLSFTDTDYVVDTFTDWQRQTVSVSGY